MSDHINEKLVALLPRLRRFARVQTNSMDEADDLVQSTVERALDRLHQWRPESRLDSWMFRIMKNIRLTQLRKLTELPQGSKGENDIKFSVDGVRYIEAKLTMGEVQQAFSGLSEAQREILYLVCVEGLPYKEAAEVLTIPIGTVMSRLARARLALHQRLGGIRNHEAGHMDRQSLERR